METNKTIQFCGFSPSKQTQTFLNELLDQILYSAPHNSALNAVLSKKENNYKITVQINSSVKRFFAMASHSRLKCAIDTIEEQLKRQIEKWKALRFEPVSITDLEQRDDVFSTEEGVYHERNTVA